MQKGDNELKKTKRDGQTGRDKQKGRPTVEMERYRTMEEENEAVAVYTYYMKK